jgi:hypothetical protein
MSPETSDNGYSLLKRWLSPEQRRDFEERGSFEVVGCHTGGRYRVCAGGSDTRRPTNTRWTQR